MEKNIKPKRQYIRKKNIKIEELPKNINEITEPNEEINEKDEIFIRYPDILNLDSEFKKKVCKILNGNF